MKVNWINVIVFLCTVPALILFFLIGFWFRVFQYGFKTGMEKCDIFMNEKLYK